MRFKFGIYLCTCPRSACKQSSSKCCDGLCITEYLIFRVRSEGVPSQESQSGAICPHPSLQQVFKKQNCLHLHVRSVKYLNVFFAESVRGSEYFWEVAIGC